MNDSKKKVTPDTHWQVFRYKKPIRIEIKSSKGETAFIKGGGNSKHYDYPVDAFEFMAITFDRDSEDPKFVCLPWKLIQGKSSVSYKQLKEWENNFKLAGYVE